MIQAPVIVFGATSAGGVELCRQLRDVGTTVIAVTRPTSDLSQLAPMGVEIRTADAMNRTQVDHVYADAGPGAVVVSLLGGGLFARPPVDSVGNINVIEGAVAARASRFVLITTIGCGETKKTASRMTRLILGRLMRAKNKAEKRLRDSKLSWTIIRPGALTKKKKPAQGILVDNPKAIGAISRIDMARLIYRVLNNDETVGQIYTAVDHQNAHTVDDSEIVEVAI